MSWEASPENGPEDYDDIGDQLRQLEQTSLWLFTSADSYLAEPNARNLMKLRVATAISEIKFGEVVRVVFESDDDNQAKINFVNSLQKTEDLSRVGMFNTLADRPICRPAKYARVEIGINDQLPEDMGIDVDEMYIDPEIWLMLYSKNMEMYRGYLHADVSKVIAVAKSER